MTTQDLSIRILFNEAQKFTAPLEKGMGLARHMKAEINAAVQENMAAIRKMQTTLNATQTLENMQKKLDTTSNQKTNLQTKEKEITKIIQNDKGQNSVQYQLAIKELPKLQAEIRKTVIHEKKLSSQTKQLQESLQSAGIKTEKLSSEQKRLQQAITIAEDKLDSQGGAYQQAQLRLERYEKALKTAKQSEKDVAHLSQLKQKYDAQKTAIHLAEQKHKTMEARQVSGAKAILRHAKALERSEAKIKKMTQAAKDQQKALAGVEKSLQTAGLDSKNLGNAQTELEKRMQSANNGIQKQISTLSRLSEAERKAAQESKAAANARIEAERRVAREQKEHAQARINAQRKLEQRQQAAQNSMVTGAGTIYTGQSMTRTAMQPVKKAIEDEAAFAGVQKVVDFEDDEDANNFKKQIQEMSANEIPMLATDLYKIAQAGGQLGIAKKDIKDFTRVTAVMSTAFDMDADQAGDDMAKLANIYEIPVDSIEDIGDAINHLSNNTAAKANEMVEVLGRVGGIAKGFGLTAVQAAALSDTMLALGKTPEVAGTGINALLLKMQTATLQSKDFKKGLKKIGYTAEDLEKQVLNNAQGALTEFLDTLKEIPKEDQMKVIGQLFGAEYADDISALVGGLKQYHKALNLIGDESNYAFSMQLEFENKLKTTKAQMTLLDNQVNMVQTTLGYMLLPIVNDIIADLRPLVKALADWAEQNPELSSTLLKVAIAGGVLVIGLGVMGIMMAVLRGPLAMMAYGFFLMKNSIILATAAMWLQRTAMIAIRALAFGSLLVAMAASMSVATVATWLLNTALWAGATAMAILTSPITLTIVAIAALAAGAYYLYTNWSTVQAYLSDTTWGRVLLAIIDAVIFPFKMLYQLITWLYDGWNKASTTFSNASWSSILQSLIMGLTAPFQFFINLLKNIKNMWGGVTSAFAETAWGQKLIGMIDKVKSALSSLSDTWNAAKKMTSDKISGGWNKAKGAASRGWQSAKSFVGLGNDPETDGKRATGGEVAKGGFYQVNELGPELITMANKTYLMASNDAYITPLISQVPPNFMAANNAAMNYAQPQVSGSLALSEELQQPLTTPNQTTITNKKQNPISIGDIHIHPSTGMNEEALGEKVQQVLQEFVYQQQNNSNALYDVE